ncbi:MAG: VWA domain-containing protein [Gemmatimonadaceae bacterium]|jgi:Ca-activated chloride channel family protein|nr:VWA domain-containing protein [Gemmatimonadaceae bacterium]
MEQTLALDWQRHPSGGLLVRLLATFSGQPPVNAARVPLSLCLVLDRSGSMEGDRLEAARTAARTVAQRMHPDDRLGVVLFDHDVQTLAEPNTAAHQPDLLERLVHVTARGSTNLSGGWLRGEQLLHALAGEGRTTRLVLLTDGHANQGIVDPAQLRALAAGARARGVTTSTVGFGEGYDEDLLRGLADAGGGNAWYVERPDQATDVFGEELGGLLALVAQDVQVTLRLRGPAAHLELLQDWPASGIANGIRLDLGDLHAREPKRVLARWFVPDAFVAPDTVLGEVECTAAVVTPTGIERRVTTTPITASFDAQERVEPTIAREVLAAEAARARQRAVELGDQGDAAGAASYLSAAASAMGSLAPDDPATAEQVRELEAMARKYAYREVSESDRKYLKQRAYNQRRGKAGYDAMLRRKPESGA